MLASLCRQTTRSIYKAKSMRSCPVFKTIGNGIQRCSASALAKLYLPAQAEINLPMAT
jgi:hypothetical protein